MIQNPIIPGFHPDPSIVRVGDDFFIATSTFEWFPGIPVYHSRDLTNWRLIGHVFTRRLQLDLAGVPDSAGLWAPSLSFHEGRFYLVVTRLRARATNFKDMQVLLATATSIHGPWSDPVFMDSWGFDPSLFHDLAGKSWLVNIEWDFRKGKSRFAGIYCQQFDRGAMRLVGARHLLLRKPQLIEGPNLYQHDGWYYLMCAEGGTGWNHGISMARSRNMEGPYEFDPLPLLLTSRKSPGSTLQKAGHGELVQTQAGEWYLVHLASRPIYPERRCILGRETCMQKVEWSADGWLRLAHDGSDPKEAIADPAGLQKSPYQAWVRDDFDDVQMKSEWCSLREPIESNWADLQARPGHLRLVGRESLHSLHAQSLVARRLHTLSAIVTTCMEFHPTHYTQAAGLICYYDTRTHYYLQVSADDGGKKSLSIQVSDDGTYDELPVAIDVCNWSIFYLQARIEQDRLQFKASADNLRWINAGPSLDMSKLSDDYGQGLHFTGAMVGLCAQDLHGNRAFADFDFFSLENV